MAQAIRNGTMPEATLPSLEAPLCSLDSLAAGGPDGAMLAIPKDSSGVAMAATRELIRRGVRDLHVLCVPIAASRRTC